MTLRSDQPDSQNYRLCAGAVLFNRDGRVWVGQRVDTPGAWQMPQGGIDAGEDPLTAARREVAEEIGTDKLGFLAEADGWLAYDLPPALAAKMWGGNYRGQMQKWFAFRFEGADSDIDIDGVEKPEFNAWKWVSIGDLPALIVDFKRPVYKELVAEFGRFANRTARETKS